MNSSNLPGSDLPESDLSAALAGDTKAYAAVLRWAAARLRPYLRRQLGSVTDLDVEDVVQEALLTIHGKWHTYDPQRPFAPWMYTIARHKLVDLLRKRHLHLPLEAAEHVAQEEHDASAGRDASTLLNTLPASQRQAIELTKIKELPVEEAARQMGKSGGAVKLLVHRGMAALKEKIGS